MVEDIYSSLEKRVERSILGQGGSSGLGTQLELRHVQRVVIHLLAGCALWQRTGTAKRDWSQIGYHAIWVEVLFSV